MTNLLLRDNEDDICTLTPNRPDQRNAVNRDVFRVDQNSMLLALAGSGRKCRYWNGLRNCVSRSSLLFRGYDKRAAWMRLAYGFGHELMRNAGFDPAMSQKDTVARNVRSS